MKDYKKLSRNYAKYPVKSKEELDYEDTYYLYWTCNLTKGQVAKILGCSESKLYKWIKQHNLIKTQNMITSSQKNLMVEKYGTDNYMKTEEGKQKLKEIINKTFSERKEEIIQKRKQTWTEKYGVDNPSKVQKIKDKKVQTCLRNYGVKSGPQNEEIKSQIKQTFIEKYGGNPLSKCSIKYRDTKAGLLDKYGYENPMQNKEIAKKTSETLKSRQEIYRKRNLEKYGVENTSQLRSTVEKCCHTKRKNNSFNRSEEENNIHRLLKLKFSNVISQYKSEKYPFLCDFYIPEMDLYIEYQGNWTHGEYPFDENDEKCIKRL